MNKDKKVRLKFIEEAFPKEWEQEITGEAMTLKRFLLKLGRMVVKLSGDREFIYVSFYRDGSVIVMSRGRNERYENIEEFGKKNLTTKRA